MSLRVLVRDEATTRTSGPGRRSIAVVGDRQVVYFHGSTDSDIIAPSRGYGPGAPSPQCTVELADIENDGQRLDEFSTLNWRPPRQCFGCLGLIAVRREVFLCVITEARQVAIVQPKETASRIYGVEFYCVTRSGFDCLQFEGAETNLYTSYDDFETTHDQYTTGGLDHPCLALRKLLADGTFYYSPEFDLTRRVQDRAGVVVRFDVGSFDPAFMWNSHMLKPLQEFRSRVNIEEREKLDKSGLLACVIRGFVESLTVQLPAPSVRQNSGRLPASLTLISRLSCRRAGTRFNSRGVDDDGHVANFVETETIIWYHDSKSPSTAVEFSYCQVRGSIPIFWEQQTGIFPNQQKIHITRSIEATQPAFDTHIQALLQKYSAVHIINLLSETKSGEVELAVRYRRHVANSLSPEHVKTSIKRPSEQLVCSTDYDFHAETKSSGCEAASYINEIVEDFAGEFGYLMVNYSKANSNAIDWIPSVSRKQGGVFRTNCLDCLDRTNLIQEILSRKCLQLFLDNRNQTVPPELWVQHAAVWADNGDVKLNPTDPKQPH